MVISKTKVQLHANHAHPEFLTSILAARSIIIKTTTLLGTAGCLIMERFLDLESTLWVCLIPLAFGFFPILNYKLMEFPRSQKQAGKIKVEHEHI